MKKITLIRFTIFVLGAVAMFLAVTPDVFGTGVLPPVLTGIVVSYLSFKFDKLDWPGLPGWPVFLHLGTVAGLLVGLPVYFVYFSMK